MLTLLTFDANSTRVKSKDRTNWIRVLYVLSFAVCVILVYSSYDYDMGLMVMVLWFTSWSAENENCQDVDKIVNIVIL